MGGVSDKGGFIKTAISDFGFTYDQAVGAFDRYMEGSRVREFLNDEVDRIAEAELDRLEREYGADSPRGLASGKNF